MHQIDRKIIVYRKRRFLLKIRLKLTRLDVAIILVAVILAFILLFYTLQRIFMCNQFSQFQKKREEIQGICRLRAKIKPIQYNLTLT